MVNLLWLIPLLPLLGAVINGALGKRLSRGVIGAIACGSVALSFAISADGLPSDAPHAGREPAHRPELLHVDSGGILPGHSRLHARSPLRVDDPDRHRRWIPDSRLLDGLHARRSRVLSLLCVPEPVHVLDADAGPGEQLSPDVCRMGRCRSLLLSPDWILVQEAIGRGRRQEGLHRQPRRRLWIPPRGHADLLDVQERRLRSGLFCSGCNAGRAAWRCGNPHGDLSPDVRWSHRQVCADSALRLAARRHGRPDSRQRAHSRCNDGHRRRVHGGPFRGAVRSSSRRLAGRCRLSVLQPHLWPHRSLWFRPTSRRSWPIRPSASSATCSSPAAPEPMPPAYSI